MQGGQGAIEHQGFGQHGRVVHANRDALHAVRIAQARHEEDDDGQVCLGRGLAVLFLVNVCGHPRRKIPHRHLRDGGGMRRGVTVKPAHPVDTALASDRPWSNKRIAFGHCGVLLPHTCCAVPASITGKDAVQILS